MVMRRVQFKHSLGRDVSDGHAPGQFKYRLKRHLCEGLATCAIEEQFRKRDMFDGHATGAIKVQARERYLIVMQWVQLKYRLERYISEGQATGAIKVQARQRYI